MFYAQRESNLVFYAQSTITVISGRIGRGGGGGGGGFVRERGRERESERERDFVFYAQRESNWYFTPSQPLRLYQGELKGGRGGGGFVRERELKHCCCSCRPWEDSLHVLLRCSTCVMVRGSRDKGVGDKGSTCRGGGGGGMKGWYGRRGEPKAGLV